jgi:hypothetical protein
MKPNVPERLAIATVLIGCGSLRAALIKMNEKDRKWCNSIRTHFDNIQQSLTGSDISMRAAVNAWDEVKQILDDGFNGTPYSADEIDDVMYLFGAVDETFYAMLDKAGVPFEPEINMQD